MEASECFLLICALSERRGVPDQAVGRSNADRWRRCQQVNEPPKKNTRTTLTRVAES